MPSPHELAESFRKAPRRGDALLALDAIGIAHAAHLADVLGMTPHRVLWIMHGKTPYYRPERCLVPLGLARERPAARGRVFEITSLGASVAASLRVMRSIDARNSRVTLAHLRRARGSSWDPI